jgi:lipid II:glycine glycyltransferase (peptidoglycan interpeptide bridge formation enzyme)
VVIIDRKIGFFRSKQVFLADEPFDLKKCDIADFVYCTKRVEVPGFKRKENLTLITDLTKSLNDIWNDFARSTAREINDGNKLGIKVKFSNDFGEFFRIYKQFNKQKGLSLAFGLFDIKMETIQKYGTLMYACYEDDVLLGNVYLEDENRIASWFSVSKRLGADPKRSQLIAKANRMTHWEMIKCAKAKGLRDFDWGGIWRDEEIQGDPTKMGINSFKIRFGGIQTHMYSYEKIYTKKYLMARYVFGILEKCRNILYVRSHKANLVSEK